MHACMCACRSACLYVCMHACIDVNHAYIHIFTHTYIYACARGRLGTDVSPRSVLAWAAATMTRSNMTKMMAATTPELSWHNDGDNEYNDGAADGHAHHAGDDDVEGDSNVDDGDALHHCCNPSAERVSPASAPILCTRR